MRRVDLAVVAVLLALVAAALTACASTREPTLCELAAKHPETKDPIVASMLGLPTQGCK